MYPSNWLHEKNAFYFCLWTIYMFLHANPCSVWFTYLWCLSKYYVYNYFREDMWIKHVLHLWLRFSESLSISVVFQPAFNGWKSMNAFDICTKLCVPSSVFVVPCLVHNILMLFSILPMLHFFKTLLRTTKYWNMPNKMLKW